jgi:uncharacterized protein
MTQPAKSSEPSMEEILASIRRIIADDDANKSAPEPPPASSVAPPAPPPAPRPSTAAPRLPTASPVETPLSDPENSSIEDDQAADILELTESMAAPMPAPAAPGPLSMSDPAPQFRKIEGSADVGFDEASERAAPQPNADGQSRLLSRATSAAVDSAFNTLAQTVLVQNARTLEDLVREMLRPMLKAWLDENLPGMVERLVRGEIERVSRGR